ncbi:uncharacterized protein LOC141852883 [Brevipalpus obovatus]|uniref:uncharacterized protein LOC141852883 n=1 Tax=Brevipalpus obovatus TaxID=246614 RepID=UPI003D9E1255
MYIMNAAGYWSRDMVDMSSSSSSSDMVKGSYLADDGDGQLGSESDLTIVTSPEYDMNPSHNGNSNSNINNGHNNYVPDFNFSEMNSSTNNMMPELIGDQCNGLLNQAPQHVRSPSFDYVTSTTSPPSAWGNTHGPYAPPNHSGPLHVATPSSNGYHDIGTSSTPPSYTAYCNYGYPGANSHSSHESYGSPGNNMSYENMCSPSPMYGLPVTSGWLAPPFLPYQPQGQLSQPTPTSHMEPNRNVLLNGSVLVNILTCRPIPGLRNLAPAPPRSQAGSINSSDKLKILPPPNFPPRKRRVANVNSSGIISARKEPRPKIFDIHQIKIGNFQLEATFDNAQRQKSSVQLRVVFEKKRLCYEFGSQSPQPSRVHQEQLLARPITYFVIQVPFELISGLNIEDSCLFVVINKAPHIWNGTSSTGKRQVHFKEYPEIDPTQGAVYHNALHIIKLKPTHVKRLRESLKNFDHRFARMLGTPIDKDPCSHVMRLEKAAKEEIDEPSRRNIDPGRVSMLEVSNQPFKKPKLRESEICSTYEQSSSN